MSLAYRRVLELISKFFDRVRCVPFIITSAAPGGGSAPAPSASSAGAAELAVPCRPCGHHMAGVAPAGASRRERGSSAQAAERDRVLLEDCIHTRVKPGYW